MLFLRTFGGLSLTGASGNVEGGVNGTRLSLLAFLAASGNGGVRRDRILLTFWGDSDQERARNALKQAVFALRRYSGRSDLLIGVDELQINPEALASDVGQFRAAIRDGRLDEAVNIYAGNFLDGVFVRSAPEFEQWRDNQQKKLLDEYHSALRHLAQNAESANDLDTAVRYWKTLAHSAPLDTNTALGLIDALHRHGNRAEALFAARQHEIAIQRELGIAPDPRILGAVAAIRASAPLGKSEDIGATPHIDAAATSASSSSRHDEIDKVPLPRRRLSANRIYAFAALLTVVASSALFISSRWRGQPQTTLVIAFDNETGDPSLNAVGSLIADWTAGQIGASGITHAAPSMNSLGTGPRSRQKRSSADLAMHAVSSDGFAFAVGGAFYRSNDSIIVEPVVVDSKSRAMLGSVRPVRVPVAQINVAAEQVAQMVTGALAVAMNEHVRVLQTPAERAPRYDAYTAYLEGLELFHDDNQPAAYASFAHARELDSTFVLPIIWQTFAVPTNPGVRDSLTRVLQSYAGRLSPLEHYAAAYLRADVDDDQGSALQNAMRASGLAPGSNWSYNAAVKLSLFNREDEALAKLAEIDPRTWVANWPAYWRFYIATAHRSGDDPRAYELIDKARSFGVSPLVLLRFHSMLQAAAGNEAGVAHDYKAYTAITTSRDSLLLFFAIAVNEAAYHGHSALRRKLGDSLIRVASVPGDTSSRRLAILADAYSTAGRDDEAWPLMLRYRAHTTDSVWTYGMLGLIAARSHRQTPAVAYSDSLAVLTSVMKGEATLYRARIAAALHDTRSAMRLIRQAYAERKQIMWQHGSDFEELAGYPEFEALKNPESSTLDDHVRSASVFPFMKQ